MQLKASASGARRSSGWMALMIVSAALVCLCPSAVSARSVKEAQAAFDKKQYEEALNLIEQMIKDKELDSTVSKLSETLRSLVVTRFVTESSQSGNRPYLPRSSFLNSS